MQYRRARVNELGVDGSKCESTRPDARQYGFWERFFSGLDDGKVDVMHFWRVAENRMQKLARERGLNLE